VDPFRKSAFTFSKHCFEMLTVEARCPKLLFYAAQSAHVFRRALFFLRGGGKSPVGTHPISPDIFSTYSLRQIEQNCGCGFVKPVSTKNRRKKMKSKLPLAVAASALVLAAFTGSLQAVPIAIDGTISFSGTATTDTTSLLTSTKFTAFQDVTVGAPSALYGAYLGTSGASVTMTPFTWNPPGASTPINPLWTFVSGGNTYSFNLSMLHQDFVSPLSMILSGSGTAFITGPGSEYLPTTGLWSLTTQTFGQANFTFSSTTKTQANSVADGGSTVFLLGTCLLGFAFVQRRLVA